MRGLLRAAFGSTACLLLSRPNLRKDLSAFAGNPFALLRLDFPGLERHGRRPLLLDRGASAALRDGLCRGDVAADTTRLARTCDGTFGVRDVDLSTIDVLERSGVASAASTTLGLVRAWLKRGISLLISVEL